MSSRFSLAAGILLASLAALPLSAQQSTGGALRDTTGAKASVAKGSASDSALVELGRAITALALSVQTVVEETAKNPEVRRAALQTASKAVTLAQRTLEENQSEIERLLAEASRKLAAADATQKAKLEQLEKGEKSEKTPQR
ncbi:MAG TPA: hypothetical protein VKA54_00845 [Gemmatimonadaceae bacterium]|nr:hypothetical protein [Gemmatimonadaceae bacterium]